MSEKSPLAAVRKRIDVIDEQLEKLITERAQCALDVAKIKRQAGENNFYRPEREAQILQNVKSRNSGVLPDDEMARLFREIMSACLALEQPLKISYLGPEGTYTQAAAFKHFGHSVTTEPVSAIDEVFREVESGAADFGIVPVENSTEGMVNQSMDMFVHSPLIICGEVQLRIHHHFLSRLADMKSIQRIYSHQQSFAQCREWLNNNMLGVERVSVNSNAEAARFAAQENYAAAIAGETAGEIYHLQSLAENIEDDPQNTTRFLVLGRDMIAASGKDKTSLLLSSQNRPGALYSLLEPFRRFGVSMTRVESRPSRQGMWEYVFFVDIDGHVSDKNVQQALSEVKKCAAMFKILGSYPRAVISG
ncbi:MAG TPA: prephenate dehydratase [Gammaproteobacteria bacterium]|nr:prephenate dehydratase [Gammaproteobacteria bacterium]